MAEERRIERAGTQGTQAGNASPNVRWDDTQMRSSYANVANVASTREEVVLLFGVNQTWHSGQNEVTVQLTDRIILNPHAAKRLHVLLTNVLREYEGRFGVLTMDNRRSNEPGSQTQAS